jgi:hypothetical protein
LLRCNATQQRRQWQQRLHLLPLFFCYARRCKEERDGSKAVVAFFIFFVA